MLGRIEGNSVTGKFVGISVMGAFDGAVVTGAPLGLRLNAGAVVELTVGDEDLVGK